jgi:hypothetical protein
MKSGLSRRIRPAKDCDAGLLAARARFTRFDHNQKRGRAVIVAVVETGFLYCKL